MAREQRYMEDTEPMAEEDKPRVLRQDGAKDIVPRYRQTMEPPNPAENVSLTTKRDIRCFVMTEAELSSLLIAVTIMHVCSGVAVIALLFSLVFAIYNPSYKDLAGASVIGVIIVAACGNWIAYKWKNSIVNEIRNGARFDAGR